MKLSTRFRTASVLALLLSAGCGTDGNDPPGRAILVSIDAMNEAILRATLTREEAPALHRLFDEAMCADHAISHFPSQTAPSHAVLWTGAHGNVSGVTANTMTRLPRDRHTLLEMTNGFHYPALAAEPLWISAGLAGVPVAGHHVTQAPGIPGYRPEVGAPSAEAEARRADAERALARGDVNVLNGYNRTIAPQRVLGGSDVTWSDPAEWRGVEALSSALPPRAFVWTLPEAGELHGLLVAEGTGAEAGAAVEGETPRYDLLLLSPDADVDGAATARAAPVEKEPHDGVRELGRHFSEPIALPVDGGRVHVTVRLFEVAEDGSDFMLYHPPIHVVEGNRRDMTRDYEDAIGGWTGNSGFFIYRTGGFGPRLMEGGDGTAESRFLETSEHVLRQFDRGAEWLWRTFEPRLLMDYFPVADEIDHELIGRLDPAWPGYDDEMAARVRELRARFWALVDHRVGRLMELADEAGAALFLTGDHGMRAYWNLFLPNLLLRDAGLLVLDDAGGIDLSRTRALSPNGQWITVNRAAWAGGIVPDDEVDEVIEAVLAALEGFRTPDGARAVSRVFTPESHTEFGIGGPAGGDVYWATAPEYISSASVNAAAPVVPLPSGIGGGHGFAPDEPDMYTVFCAWGGGFKAGRIPAVRTTVVAPTVAEYTGIPRPRDAVDRSVLDAMRRGGDPLADALRARISEAGDSVDVAVAFHDLESGRRLAIDGDEVFHAASTMKVPVLYELFRRHDDGELDVDAEVPVVTTFRSVHDGSPFVLESDSDEELLAAAGGTLPARRVARGIIVVSSNLGTNILLEMLGPEAVQARMDRLGASGMRVRRGVSDIPAFEAGYSNETTARGLLRVMEIIARCEEMSRATCADMHEILEAQEYVDDIPAGIPAGVRVGNKTGSITRIRHDAAIVHAEGRAPYLLVVLTRGFADGDVASELISDLSRVVWETVADDAVSSRP